MSCCFGVTADDNDVVTCQLPPTLTFSTIHPHNVQVWLRARLGGAENLNHSTICTRERETTYYTSTCTVRAGLYNVKAHSSKVLYSEKLSREKTFINFVVLWLFTKVFSAKFGGMASFGMAKASNLRKFSLICKRFSPSKVACYTVQLTASRSQTCKVLEALLTRYCWD